MAAPPPGGHPQVGPPAPPPADTSQGFSVAAVASAPKGKGRRKGKGRKDTSTKGSGKGKAKGGAQKGEAASPALPAGPARKVVVREDGQESAPWRAQEAKQNKREPWADRRQLWAGAFSDSAKKVRKDSGETKKAHRLRVLGNMPKRG